MRVKLLGERQEKQGQNKYWVCCIYGILKQSRGKEKKEEEGQEED